MWNKREFTIVGNKNMKEKLIVGILVFAEHFNVYSDLFNIFSTLSPTFLFLYNVNIRVLFREIAQLKGKNTVCTFVMTLGTFFIKYATEVLL